jgi:hypothetical protein
LIRPLERLHRLIERGLDHTRALWPDIHRAYGWVHAAARILNNDPGLEAEALARRFDGLLGAMARHRATAGGLAGAIDHFRKVTASYRPGLFHCYRVAGLPRTNNDLEHLFGSHRHHDRRTTGRKTASPTTVLRGPVRLLAATATRLRPVRSHELARADRQAWCDLRRRLDNRRHGRVLRTRFRRNPNAYLRQLEQIILQSTLPP